MKKLHWMTLALLIMGCCKVQAQEDTLQTTHPRQTSHVWMIGVGATNVLDTYLSPLEYSGIEARLQRETLRQTTRMNGNLYVQTILNAHASYSENKAQTAEVYEGLLNWNLGYLYNFRLNNKLRILVGPAAELNVGGVYLKRNSNNPAQGKASINVGASALALYQFKWWGHTCLARYQVAGPLFGVMFSPEFGQSYYEIFTLGHSGHNICLTTPFSQPSLRQSLTLDFPIGQTIVRIGYVGDYQQSKVNQIRTHTYSNAFMVGIVRNIQLVKAKDKELKYAPYYQ